MRGLIGAYLDGSQDFGGISFAFVPNAMQRSIGKGAKEMDADEQHGRQQYKSKGKMLAAAAALG